MKKEFGISLADLSLKRLQKWSFIAKTDLDFFPNKNERNSFASVILISHYMNDLLAVMNSLTYVF